MRKLFTFRPALNDKLEDRTVPSGFSSLASHIHVQPSQGGPVFGGGAGGGEALGGGGPGNLGGGPIGQVSGSCGGVGVVSSSLLAQDSQKVQQAFQTLSSSVTLALANLRLTATSTAGPSQAGLTAYDGAVSTAVTTLQAAITTALSNLPNTGPGLLTQITPLLTTLQTELDSAGTGLANSTSRAVRATQQEISGYIRTALNSTVSLIRNDTATGTITSSTLQTYNQAVRTAVQTFNSAINTAAQTSISGGTSLNSTAVTNAVSALQTSLTTAIAALTPSATTPLYDPTSVLATLQSQLLAIVAPTTGNSASARLFLRSINSTIDQNLSQINQGVSTAVQTYNNSLL